jgi:hypothetical protein
VAVEGILRVFEVRGEATVLPAFDYATAFGVNFMDFDTHV